MVMEAVFVESLLDDEDLESPLSLSPTLDVTSSCFDNSKELLVRSCHGYTERSDGDSSGHASWDMDVPSGEARELETVFEDDVLSDSSGCLERSSSNCSMLSDFRDRSGSTWSAMTLCDRDRSNSVSGGFRGRSYSSTCAYYEPTTSSSESGYRQRSYSIATDYRQRSGSMDNIGSNPLHQTHRLSIHYLRSAFTFLDPKGKFGNSVIVC